jgi:ATP-dependent exoDNAse (exonuclease V) beta subunit
LQPELLSALTELDADAREAARKRAEQLLALALDNGILERLADLKDHVVARELAVLLPPTPEDGADAPVGFVSGAIDLVYRDADTNELVVADYKTDDVTEEAEIQARIETYRPQGAVYTQALRDSLGLKRTPRFELWFLRAGRVEVV